MNEEIRTEEIMETEIAGTEDVKEGLTAAEYGVIGGIMIAGIAVFEGGKWVWKKTAPTRGKVSGFFKDKLGKKADSEAKETPDQEGSEKKAEKKSDAKKSEDKKSDKK